MADQATPDTGNKKPICYFTDKLSAETRILIYGYVFGAGEYAKIPEPVVMKSHDKIYSGLEEGSDCGLQSDDAVSDADEDSLDEQHGTRHQQRLHTGIVATCKLLHDEALEALYNTKVTRLTFRQLDRFLLIQSFRDLVRDIELTDCDKVRGARVRYILEQAQALPRIRAVTILSDSLALSATRDGHIMVRDFVRSNELGELVCTDIGRYELRGTGRFDNIKFVHAKLRKMWPQVIDTPEGYNALKSAHEAIRDMPYVDVVSTSLAWACHTSFRMWVGMAELFKATKERREYGQDLESCEVARDDFPTSFERNMTHFSRTIMSCEGVDLAYSGADRDVPIHKLRPGHNPQTLEAVTELLSMNIRCYRPGYDSTSVFKGSFEDWQPHRGGHMCARPRWKELGEDSEPTIQWRREQAKHKKWIANSIVTMPSFGSDDPNEPGTDSPPRVSMKLARNDLLGAQDSSYIFNKDEVEDADKDSLQRMFWLLRATEKKGRDYHEEGEEAWSANLLRKYIKYTISAEHDQAIDEASLEQLQRVVLDAVALTQLEARLGPLVVQSVEMSKGGARQEEEQDENKGKTSAIDTVKTSPPRYGGDDDPCQQLESEDQQSAENPKPTKAQKAQDETHHQEEEHDEETTAISDGEGQQNADSPTSQDEEEEDGEVYWPFLDRIARHLPVVWKAHIARPQAVADHMEDKRYLPPRGRYD